MKNQKVKTPLNAHTPKTQIGMGNHYGSGIRNKVGRMREDSIGQVAVSPKGLKKPPRSLA
jgi:hypothetical protein